MDKTYKVGQTIEYIGGNGWLHAVVVSIYNGVVGYRWAYGSHVVSQHSDSIRACECDLA